MAYLRPKLSPKSQLFKLKERHSFDARKGFKRCEPPGVSVRQTWQSTADFWRDRCGQIVVRCECNGYRFSFDARMKSGVAIPDDQMDAFAWFITDVLFLWLVEGIDDVPTVDDIYLYMEPST